MKREDKKQQEFNHRMNQYYLYQLGESLTYDLQSKLYKVYPNRGIKLDFEVSQCSLDIFVKGYDYCDQDFAHIVHIHTEDTVWTLLHYQHTLNSGIKRINEFLKVYFSQKEGK